MVPVFLEAAPIIPHAVLAEEREIIREFGWFHVDRERYYASAPDADKMRRLEAERRVDERRAAERREAQLRAGVVCAWCDKLIVVGEPAVIIEFRWLHAAPCAEEFESSADDRAQQLPDPAAAAGPGGENDPRWALVTADTTVDFDGEMTSWGQLMIQDRKTVRMLKDGRLVGGYR